MMLISLSRSLSTRSYCLKKSADNQPYKGHIVHDLEIYVLWSMMYVSNTFQNAI